MAERLVMSFPTCVIGLKQNRTEIWENCGSLCPFVFSQNEELEEIASADLKYLLLPALLGALTLKQINLSKRLEHVQSARAHFMNFLKLCKSYQIGKFQLPETPESPGENESSESTSKAGPAVGQPSLVAMAVNRQAKIER